MPWHSTSSCLRLPKTPDGSLFKHPVSLTNRRITLNSCHNMLSAFTVYVCCYFASKCNLAAVTVICISASGLIIASYLRYAMHMPPNQHTVIHFIWFSRLQMLPKAHKWRLICDLSAPHGHSINGGIPTALCSMRYATVHDAVSIVNVLGRDTQLVKLDPSRLHAAGYHMAGSNLASFPGRFFSKRTERRKKGLVSIAQVIVRMRQI